MDNVYSITALSWKIDGSRLALVGCAGAALTVRARCAGPLSCMTAACARPPTRASSSSTTSGQARFVQLAQPCISVSPRPFRCQVSHALLLHNCPFNIHVFDPPPLYSLIPCASWVYMLLTKLRDVLLTETTGHCQAALNRHSNRAQVALQLRNHQGADPPLWAVLTGRSTSWAMTSTWWPTPPTPCCWVIWPRASSARCGWPVL